MKTLFLFIAMLFQLGKPKFYWDNSTDNVHATIDFIKTGEGVMQDGTKFYFDFKNLTEGTYNDPNKYLYYDTWIKTTKGFRLLTIMRYQGKYICFIDGKSYRNEKPFNFEGKKITISDLDGNNIIYQLKYEK